MLDLGHADQQQTAHMAKQDQHGAGQSNEVEKRPVATGFVSEPKRQRTSGGGKILRHRPRAPRFRSSQCLAAPSDADLEIVLSMPEASVTPAIARVKRAARSLGGAQRTPCNLLNQIVFTLVLTPLSPAGFGRVRGTTAGL